MNEMPLPADAQTTRSDASLGVWDADVAADDSTRPTMDATQEQCIRVGPNCEPGPPHNDVVGMVCAHDGTDEEGYCTVDNAGQMICARSDLEGLAPGAASPPPTRMPVWSQPRPRSFPVTAFKYRAHGHR